MHLLLEGLAEVPDPLTESVRLVVVGDGPADYQERLRSIEESNRDRLPPIDWEGAVWGDEKWTYLQGADLFCLPTHSENFGLVVLEACQVGTPVLTTTGTPWRFLEDWNSGLIAEPNADSLETALQRYLTSFAWSQTQRTELAERTRKRFSLESVGRQYLDMYTTVIEETSALHSR
jgi:glycosyltransferase involved in cell wall biosynthesis